MYNSTIYVQIFPEKLSVFNKFDRRTVVRTFIINKPYFTMTRKISTCSLISKNSSSTNNEESNTYPTAKTKTKSFRLKLIIISASFGFVFIGTLKTICIKLCDQTKALNSAGADVYFNHPYLQTWGYFFGEQIFMFYILLKLCIQISAFWRPIREQNSFKLGNQVHETDTLKHFGIRNSWLAIPPMICDLITTVLIYIGLNLTTASSYQMISGSVVIFTGIGSHVFLGRRLRWFQWLGMMILCIGLITIGLGDLYDHIPVKCYIRAKDSTNNETYNVKYDIYPLQPLCENEVKQSARGMSSEILGDLFVIVAQITLSFQIVYEDYILSNYTISPLELLAWEGSYGFIMMSFLLVILNYIDIENEYWSSSPSPPWVIENSLDGFIQLSNNMVLLVAFLIASVSGGIFSLLSIYLTGKISGTSTVILDQLRTIIVWTVSLILEWQHFQLLALLGFFFLIVGTAVYYYLEIIPMICKQKKQKKHSVSKQILIHH